MPTDLAAGSTPTAAPLFAGAALLDAERLDAYRVALEFQAMAGQLVPKRGYSELHDQLERASISIVLNIADGPRLTEMPAARLSNLATALHAAVVPSQGDPIGQRHAPNQPLIMCRFRKAYR